MAPRKRKEYYPRVNPYTRYNNYKFVQRYHLNKVTVAGLANAFGQSRFCSTRGSQQSGGISIVEGVSIVFGVLYGLTYLPKQHSMWAPVGQSWAPNGPDWGRYGNVAWVCLI